MEKQRTITVKVLLSEEEKNSIEEKSKNTPLSRYFRECALSDPVAAQPDAREMPDLGEEGDIILAEITERFGSLQKFMDQLMYKLDVAGDKSVYRWLEESGKGKPQASHPYYGWTVAIINQNRQVLVTSGGREMAISAENDNEELLTWFFADDGTPYYQIGEVIGKEVPFRKE